MLELREDVSHTDHGLTQDQMAFVLEKFADRNAFFVEVVEMPEGLGTVPNALYGPSMNDGVIEESEVRYERRAGRPGASRVIDRPTRPTHKLVVVAGPNPNFKCVLYTVYGGDFAAPREPFDDISGDDWNDSIAFWQDHALSA